MENLKIPNHLAIIMDGNGRWAKQRGKKRSMGHLEGSKTLEDLAVYAVRRGIKVLSVYAFSTDNFKRSEDEVSYLMNLFTTLFKTKLKKIQNEGIKVVFSGRKHPLSDEVLDAMDKIAKDIENGKLKEEDLNKEIFNKYLYQDLPPIDLLIRTSGEYRVSNFMLYQMSYSEFYFTDTLFPDFKESELDKAIESYNHRDRRFGNAK